MNTITRGPYVSIEPLYRLFSSLSKLGLNVSVQVRIRGHRSAHTILNKPEKLLNYGGVLHSEHLYLVVNIASSPHIDPRGFCVTLDSLINIVQPSPLGIPR